MSHTAGHVFRFSPWPILMTLAAIGLAVGVFTVTQTVQQREARVSELNRRLLSEQQTLRVLDAEWAYLTRPQRLESLMVMKAQGLSAPPVAMRVAPIESPASAPVPAKVEPAAGGVEAIIKEAVKPATVQKAASVKPAAAPRETDNAQTRKTPARAAAAKAEADIVWPISRPAAAAAPVRPVPNRAAAPARAGVARPIVE